MSNGGIIRDALELFAEQMGFAKLEKKYPEFIAHINAEAILKKQFLQSLI